MPFPKTKSKQTPEAQKAALQGLQIKKQQDFPLFMCEFFEGFEVLQTQGIESKEYIWGIYFGNKYCGHIYLGDRWTPTGIAQICKKVMPPTWNEIDDYVFERFGKTWYWKMHPDQYSWIYEKVIVQEKNT